MKYIDSKGNYVPEGDPASAYQVNPDDPLADEFVNRIKEQAGNTSTPEPPVPVPEPTKPATKTASKAKK